METVLSDARQKNTVLNLRKIAPFFNRNISQYPNPTPCSVRGGGMVYPCVNASIYTDHFPKYHSQQPRADDSHLI